jgi:hypothetical protein
MLLRAPHTLLVRVMCAILTSPQPPPNPKLQCSASVADAHARSEDAGGVGSGGGGAGGDASACVSSRALLLATGWLLVHVRLFERAVGAEAPAASLARHLPPHAQASGSE